MEAEMHFMHFAVPFGQNSGSEPVVSAPQSCEKGVSNVFFFVECDSY